MDNGFNKWIDEIFLSMSGYFIEYFWGFFFLEKDTSIKVKHLICICKCINCTSEKWYVF